ncbi:MAG: hypothetical protein V4541_01650 [Bacteroidota bacterium]
MKQKLLFSTVLILSLLVQGLLAQTPVKTKPVQVKAQQQPVKKQVYTPRTIDTAKNTDPSLKGQYQFMLSRSKSVNGYKLINPYRLTTVWQSVSDTLRKERVELKNSKNKIAEQQKIINNLNSEIAGKETSLNTSLAKIDEIRFLGLSFTKSVYNIIVWSIIIVLAIALFVVIARSAKNILEARHRTQLYDEVAAEYQNYKTKANEKERKLARELQDERNLVEELKNRGR